MQHDESGHLPEGTQEVKNPKYPVGTTVELLTDHMSDMLHAKAVVDGEVSYEGSVGVGDQVTILAQHMSGMQNATGTIERMTTEPVYMIDYYSSDHGRWVRNHQWVVESEIKAWEE